MNASALTVRVVRSAAELDPVAWDTLTAGRPFADHRWLCLAEEINLHSEPRHLLVERAGNVLAAAVCFVDRAGLPAFLRRFELVRGIATRLCARHPALNCELPISFGPGIFAAGGTAGDEGMRRLLPAMAGVAGTERARSIRVQHLSPEHPLIPALEAKDFRPIPQGPNARLDIRWTAREEFEAWLTHKHRSEIRRIRNRAAECGLSMGVAPRGTEADPALRELIRATLLRHVRADPWVPDLLPRARRILGDDLTLLVARRDGRAAGCVAVLQSGMDLLLKWPGALAGAERVEFSYHALMVASVDLAIERRARRLWLGPTTYSLKRDLGAALDPRRMYVAECGRWSRWLRRLTPAR